MGKFIDLLEKVGIISSAKADDEVITTYYKNYNSTDEGHALVNGITISDPMNLYDDVTGDEFAPREGYDFVEWNTERDGTGTSYEIDAFIGTSGLVLYAIWTGEEPGPGPGPGPEPTRKEVSTFTDSIGDTVYFKDSAARSSAALLNSKIGSANGIASLDSTGKVPKMQSTSFIEEYETIESFPEIGSANTIYLDLTSNVIYRWDSMENEYVSISSSGSDSGIVLVDFSIAVSDWVEENDHYTAAISNRAISNVSAEIITYTSSIATSLAGNIDATKDASRHSIVFRTDDIPTGPISGCIYCIFNNDGQSRIVVVSESLGIEDGGTGATTAAGALSNLGGISISEKGVANGIAELDASGKVPSNQLPSYVDDVLEYPSLSNFPETGEIGKIYVAADSNKSYRWSGSSYIELSSYALATQAAAGLMSAADKTKLDGVATGATANVVSNSLTDTSTTNALSAAQGKALSEQIGTLNGNVEILKGGPTYMLTNVDLNTITTTGQYRVYNGCSNIPTGFTADGILIVENCFNITNSYCKQTITAGIGTWERIYAYGNWYSWRSAYDQINTLNSNIAKLKSQVRLINSSDILKNISSNTTITLDGSLDDYMFLVIEVSTENPVTSGSHGVLFVPMHLINDYAFYSLSAGAKDGHIRLYASGTTLQFIEQSVNTTLYVEDVIGISKIV